MKWQSHSAISNSDIAASINKFVKLTELLHGGMTDSPEGYLGCLYSQENNHFIDSDIPKHNEVAIFS